MIVWLFLRVSETFNVLGSVSMNQIDRKHVRVLREGPSCEQEQGRALEGEA